MMLRSNSANIPHINGAPDRIRTRDPQIRNQVLYPTELRALASDGSFFTAIGVTAA